MLILDSEIVQRLILKHGQINRNIRARLSTELEVYRVHRRTDAERLLVRHIPRAHRVPSRIAHRSGRLLRTQVVCRRVSRGINAQVLEFTKISTSSD